MLRAEGVVLYDLATNQETLYESFYDSYTLANQFLVETDRDLVVVTELDPNSFSSLSKVDDETLELLYGDEEDEQLLEQNLYDFLHTVQLPGTAFRYPVQMPTQTEFAIVKQYTNPDTGDVSSTIIVYNFASVVPKQIIELSLYDPTSIVLLGVQ